MPAFVAALLGGLINIAGTLAGRVLVALGFGVVTYTGISTSLNWLKDQVIASANALPPEYLQLLGYLKVGQFISLIFSALLVRLALNGLASDSFKRMVLK